MADLGTKYECFSCGVKFYDFGRPVPICPKCGANQKDAKRNDPVAESMQAKRKRRDEVTRAVVETEDDLLPAASEDLPDDEIETPEGVVVVDEDDLHDDEE